MTLTKTTRSDGYTRVQMAVKPPHATFMRLTAVPDGNKGAVSSRRKRPDVESDRALGETKSMKQSELDGYQSTGGPPRNESLSQADLDDLYHKQGYSGVELGEMFGVPRSTVYRHMDRQGVERRSLTVASSLRSPPTHRFREEDGYEVVKVGCENTQYTVRIHRLVAVAKWGFDAVANNDIHHIDSHPANNSHDNLELLPHGEHMSHHRKEDAEKLVFDENGDIAGWGR